MSLLAGLYNPQTKGLHEAGPDRYTDPETGGYLRAVYDYETLAETVDLETAFSGWTELGQAGFIDLLPLTKMAHLPTTEAGGTSLGSCSEHESLFIKNEAENPGKAVYDRSLALLVALAREGQFQRATLFTTAPEVVRSLARLIENVELEVIVFTNADSKVADRQFELPGNLTLIGLDAARAESYEFCREVAKRKKWYNMTAGLNPYSREAFKTLAFEIFLQLEDVPDQIYLEPDQGNLLSGLVKGFQELKIIGWSQQLPTIQAVFTSDQRRRFGWFQETVEEQVKLTNESFSGPEKGPLDLYFGARALQATGGKVRLLQEEETKSELTGEAAVEGAAKQLLAAYPYANSGARQTEVIIDRGNRPDSGGAVGETRDEESVIPPKFEALESLLDLEQG